MDPWILQLAVGLRVGLDVERRDAADVSFVGFSRL